MIQLPERLYRGDSDPKNERQVCALWSRSCLITNLACGGSGKAIFNAPLVVSVRKHVADGWDKTHFLSFTDNYETAKKFAAGNPAKPVEQVDSNSDDWRTIVYWSDTTVFQNVIEWEAGIYTASFPGNLPKHVGAKPGLFANFARAHEIVGQVGKPIKVLLIDVLKYVTAKIAEGVPDLEVAESYAKQDTEWLILPMEPFRGNDGLLTDEFSARLDNGFLSGCHKFQFRAES